MSIIFGLLMIGCVNELPREVAVLTEEVVQVAGTRAVVLGRVLAYDVVAIEDHGFEYSLAEDFSGKIVHSLGISDRTGLFTGVFLNLTLGRRYYVRSFIKLNGEVILGNVLTFSTRGPFVDFFFPKTQFPGQFITLNGGGFDETTRVFFGDVEATVTDIQFGAQMKVIVPPAAGLASVPLRIMAGGAELIAADPFNYPTGTYELLSVRLGDLRLRENIYFQQGDEFFVGLGTTNFQGQVHSEIYTIRPGGDQWRATGYPGSPHRRGVSSKTGFFGGGYGNSGLIPPTVPVYSDEFWLYQNGEYKSVPSPEFQFTNSLGFEVDQSYWAIGGVSTVKTLARSYDPSGQTWQFRLNFPFAVTDSLVHFSYQQKMYLIDKEKTLWEYDYQTAKAVKKGSYPSPFVKGVSDFGGVAIVMGDKAYVGLYANSIDFWELDLKSFEWSVKNPFGGEIRAENAGIFQDGRYVYVLRTPLFSPQMEFWRFDPNGF